MSASFRFFSDVSGATVIEYALIFVFVSVLVAAVMSVLGSSSAGLLGSILEGVKGLDSPMAGSP
jgi:Flp pilus assembly pilin Flp